MLLCSVSIANSYLNSAVSILYAYNGLEPFAIFLKKYFSLNKKFGSRDRKQISQLCYSFFRLGKSMTTIPAHDRILAGLFLCSTQSNSILEAIKPEWNRQIGLSPGEKIQLLKTDSMANEIFPWKNELSDGVDPELFNLSFLMQPDLFLRVRPGYSIKVKQQLQNTGISFKEKDANCLAMENSSGIDKLLELDKEVVIQDYSSQRTGILLEKFKQLCVEKNYRVWDCCAASGGKSIMAVDLLGNIDLTVSDIRENMLVNLQKRFHAAGIKKSKRVVADLTGEKSVKILGDFNLIIADVPCSGSGTWGRTPEQLYYFDPEKINKYSQLQQKIVKNVSSHIIPGGYMLYITCSVFKKENEEMVSFMQDILKLKLVQKELLIGYTERADTMFAALLRKPL
jgi:16S rRNA (cytosine967-C5)-methyltransferase